MRKHWLYNVFGRYLIHTRYFRLYLWGSYALVEIDVGRPGRDLAIYLWAKDSWLKIKCYWM